MRQSRIRSKTMKKEYDFSKAERGKFFNPDVEINIPVYLDSDVQTFVARIAQSKRTDASSVVNDLLKSDMKLAEIMQ